MSYEDNKFVFDFAFQPLSEQAPANAPGNYVVNTGDTLRGIAQAVYGDQKLWYLIADANALQSDADLKAGTSLRIPSYASTTHSDSTTFKPYNPNEIVGDTMPQAAPPPPPSNKCNAIATIIIIIVVIVTIYTAGAAGGAMGGTAPGAAAAGGGTVASGAAAATTATGAAAGAGATGSAILAGGSAMGATVTGLTTAQMVGAAAIGGMAGAAAGQVAGNALGVRDGYSLREIFASGITAGIASGVGSAIQGANWAQAGNGFVGGMARGAAGYLGSQYANRITGVPTSFSWAGLASSAIAGGVTASMGSGGQPAADTARGFMTNLTTNFVGGAVQSTLMRLSGRGGEQQWAQIATDSFGNALASSIVGAMQGDSTAKKPTASAQASSDTATQTHELYSQDWLDQLNQVGPLFAKGELFPELANLGQSRADTSVVSSIGIGAIADGATEYDIMGQPLNGRSN